MRSTTVLFFLCFLAILIAANPIDPLASDNEPRGTHLKKRDLDDTDSSTHSHAPFKRSPVGTTPPKKKTPLVTNLPKKPVTQKKPPTKVPPTKVPNPTKVPPGTKTKGPVACPLPKKRPGKTTGKSRRDLERRCADSAEWTKYNGKGVGYLATYETKHKAGANKATEAAIKKILQEEYFSVQTKEQSVDVNLRDYMTKKLSIPAASLLNGYTQYETYSCKPPADGQPTTMLKLRRFMLEHCKVPVAYRNLYDAQNGVILADSNFAEKDTNAARTDIKRPSLSDLLFLQYQEQAGTSPVTKLRYLARLKIVNADTATIIEEAHARSDAPADNEIPGWKKWTMAAHKKVIETLVGTDNGKAAPFILMDWAGYLAKKSLVAVHTDIEPGSKSKYMILEFSA